MNFTQSDVAAIENEDQALNADFANRKLSWVEGAISAHDARFLAGLVHRIEPGRIVEIGVASGWSSAILLTLSKERVDGRSGTASDAFMASICRLTSTPTGRSQPVPR